MSLEEQHGIDQSQSHMIDSDKVTYSDRDRKPHFNPRNYIPSALKTPDKNQPMTSVVDTNIYSIKKTAMTILCLLIIIMTNSVQLKVVTKLGSGVHPFYGTQVTLGVISILMCVFIGIVLMYSMRVDFNDKYKQRKLDYIDNCIMILLFILAIFNIFICACS